MTACETPESLEAVAGVDGAVIFTSWSDSLKGAVVVVFDKDLEFDRIDEPEYKVIDYFITYSDPISSGTSSVDYFIQLETGEYQLMVIGLLLDPAQLLANEELFQEIQKYIVIPENSAPRGIVIREKKLTNRPTGMFIFNLKTGAFYISTF
jgi:argonaute-like protein implicated in RNA metabolism and viral defense